MRTRRTIRNTTTRIIFPCLGLLPGRLLLKVRAPTAVEALITILHGIPPTITRATHPTTIPAITTIRRQLARPLPPPRQLAAIVAVQQLRQLPRGAQSPALPQLRVEQVYEYTVKKVNDFPGPVVNLFYSVLYICAKVSGIALYIGPINIQWPEKNGLTRFCP